MKRLPAYMVMLLSMYGHFAAGQKSIHAHYLETPITVDGIHEPGLWAGADSATGFIQMEPSPGTAATMRSVVYMGYDDKHLYLSAFLYQSSRVSAKVFSRDVLTKADDSFALVIDPFNDNRSGFGFWTNALGTQADFRINDDGRNIDVNWDTEWESASGVGENGWSLEMKIPFRSVRFKTGLSTWGVNFGRIILSNLETVYWAGPATDDFRISQGGKLTGLDLPEEAHRFTIFPYSTLSYSNRRPSGETEITPDLGADMKWQASPNLTIDATLNPDFATVEADQEQINLTRYEINYPEKRLFFQEGNEMYGTRIRTFYSRRIQDILYGTKINGKAGKYNYNALHTLSREPGEDLGSGSFFSTARVKRDFLESSSIGLTAVDKRNDTSFVTSFSGDYILNLGETWKLTGQFVASLPGDLLSHSAWFVRFAKESNIYHAHIRYTELGEEFRENVNQTGYVVDDDRRELDSDLSYRWWVSSDFIRFIEAESRNNIFWARTTGELRSWYITESVQMYLQNRLSLEYSYNNEFKLFDRQYYNYRHSWELGYNTAEWSFAEAGYSMGRNFERRFHRISLEGRVRFTEKLAMEYSGDWIRFIPDDDRNSTVINVISFNYNFTKDLWIRVFAQNSTSYRKIYLYGLAGWRFRPPFGAVYLIYSHDQEADLMEDLMGTDAVFLKVTLPLTLIH